MEAVIKDAKMHRPIKVRYRRIDDIRREYDDVGELRLTQTAVGLHISVVDGDWVWVKYEDLVLLQMETPEGIRVDLIPREPMELAAQL